MREGEPATGGASAPVWQAGEFIVPTTDGDQRVAGWLSELFALDFRPSLDSEEGGVTGAYGWCLTHRPSGFAMWGLIMSLSQAMAIADELAQLPGFDALRAPGAREGPDPAFMKRRCLPIRQRIGLRCIHPTAMVPPWAGAPDIATQLIEAPS